MRYTDAYWLFGTCDVCPKSTETPPAFFRGPLAPTSPSIVVTGSFEVGIRQTAPPYAGLVRSSWSSGGDSQTGKQRRCNVPFRPESRRQTAMTLSLRPPPQPALPRVFLFLFIFFFKNWLIFGTLKACKSQLSPQVSPQAPACACEEGWGRPKHPGTIALEMHSK